MPSGDADRTAVREVQGGDTEAFRPLVARHQGRIYSIIFKMVGDPALAEELTQDTFVHAFRGIGGFRGEAQFGTWLVQIGLHVVRDHIRREQVIRKRGEVPLDSLGGEGDETRYLADPRSSSDPLAALGEKELKERVARALDLLPHEYREVLVLKHFEGWSYGEIAARTGCSVGSLKVRAHRARRLLREQLAPPGHAERGAGLRVVSPPKESFHERTD
jgi:RNA polymerase sigma-70 factor (ECF subfamily)